MFELDGEDWEDRKAIIYNASKMLLFTKQGGDLNQIKSLLERFEAYRNELSLGHSVKAPSEHDLELLMKGFAESGGKVVFPQNRRYLGNKASIAGFIRETVNKNCGKIDSVCDIFAGTGAVASIFHDKTLIVNDLLYVNYVSNYAWFGPTIYRPSLILDFVNTINNIHSDEDNYMRRNFADTYFSADDCSKIGMARELVERLKNGNFLTGKEYEILIAVIIYGMDRYANTVGHYDAFRKGTPFRSGLSFPLILPSASLNVGNIVMNKDANVAVRGISADLLYLDPPYNSRQYSDAYHLLENVARWEKPAVHGIGRKMDRSALKSEYNSVRAAEALRDLVNHANCRYIAFSYNNMSNKGDSRSNAKITDEEILEILSERGEVKTFEIKHKPFSAGKSSISGNTERLFICRVDDSAKSEPSLVLSPINYIGGKGKLLAQLKPLLPQTDTFVDVFAGGCNVGINANAKHVVFNDRSAQLISLMQYLATCPSEKVIAGIDELTEKYELSRTFGSSYAAFGVTSTEGLASYNKPGFVRLRSEYNKVRERDMNDRNLLLYALVIFGFNNQMRFNLRGEFNLPVGKRDFNSKMRRKLRDFHTRALELKPEFQVGDFRSLNIEDFPQDTLFYCDPPYLITQATYNENGGWTVTDEQELLSFLDAIHNSGRKFALSNVIEAKGRVNGTLSEWIAERSYKSHELQISYSNSNYQRKNIDSLTREVLITNY